VIRMCFCYFCQLTAFHPFYLLTIQYLCDGGESVLKRLYNKMFKNPTTAALPTETGTTTFHSLLVS